MTYSRSMAEQQDWAETSKILGLAGTTLALAYKWITESFKSRREEREGVIKIAVKEAMSEVRDQIESVRAENAHGIAQVNRRIDDVFKEMKK